MNTLKAFSEKEHAYHAYQARQRAAKEQERAAKDEALAENERLKRLLANKPELSDSGTGQ